MLRSLATLAAAFLTALPLAAATACSFSSDYVPPTDFELVQISDAIVIATAREERPGEYGPAVAFDVGERVKGEAQARVELRGRIEDTEPGKLSDVVYISELCGPGPFRKGNRYILFLQKDAEGQLRRTHQSLTRTSEEYAGEDSDWMRRVRRYVRLQGTAAPMEQISILEGLSRSRRGLAGEPLSADEVRDIRDHLGSITPYKPTAYLLAAHAALEGGGFLLMESGRADGTCRRCGGAC